MKDDIPEEAKRLLHTVAKCRGLSVSELAEALYVAVVVEGGNLKELIKTFYEFDKI